uniref:Uncharacterized protein n=1 Tax=Avena sativa TaxID=4498 RepID=A0ACD5YWH8_AVESA
MGDAPCNVTPRRRRQGVLLWRWRGLGRRRKLPIVRLGRGRGRGRGRGLLRRLRLRWLAARARWLRRAVRKLAAIYMAALQGPHGAPSYPPWIGVEPCFATPFVPNARPFW